MPKLKSKWVCQQCGFQAAAFLGRCTDCGSWNSMTEEIVRDISAKVNDRALNKQNSTGGLNNPAQPIPIKEIKKENYHRLNSGLISLDEVLGGGIVPGCVVLLAGEPGIGKSTLLLQIAKSLEVAHTVLYISAEESASQVGLRASRLGILGSNLYIDTEQDVLTICQHINEQKPRLVIVDSIQTIYHPDIASTPGSVSQVRQTAEEIISTARASNTPVIIVGHINKEGVIAGPKVLEHMVDVVLQFEGDKTKQLRILRAIKNRFGAVNEIAIFSMDENGLSEINNAGAFFLSDHLDKLHGQQHLSPGTAITAYSEGNQVFFLEVQALVGASLYASPRRVANGWDYNRLLQTIAVLEKKLGLNLSSRDVYVNVVGGLNFDSPSGDLAVSVAIMTSLLEAQIPANTLLIGEIGLTGELRQVAGVDKILKEATRLGFKHILTARTKSQLQRKNQAKDGLEVFACQTLKEAFSQILPNWQNDLQAQKRQNREQSSKENTKAQSK